MSNRAYKAKQVRYRRAALALVQRNHICDELYEIAEECSTLEWSIEDDDTLIDIFDGDTDEIYEFRFAFSALSNKCELLHEQLCNYEVTEHFDDFFVGALGKPYAMVGYDSFEEDYFGLCSWDAELAQSASGKRLMKLTKENLISIAGQCVGVMMCFLDIQHSYDCLKSVFDLLKDERSELIANVMTVDDMYEKMQENPYDYTLQGQFNSLTLMLPERVWVE